MRKYLFLLIGIFQFQLLFSQSIDDETAQNVAVRFIAGQCQGDKYSIASERQILSDEGDLLCYLYSLVPHGYVAVCGDISFYPVIAYSFDAENAVPESESALINLIKTDYSNRFRNRNRLPETVLQKNLAAWERLRENNLKRSADTVFQQWPPAGSTNTGGWILTKWNQSAPYNGMCPMDLAAGNRSLTGCPATAMAQIINYHKTLNGTRFNDSDDYYHNYGSNQFNIDGDYAAYSFPSFPQLNLYLDTLEDKYLSKAPLSANDIASLHFACGIATKSVYSASGSGTFAVNQAYDGFIRMGFASAQLLDTSVHNPLPRVIANIKDSLPALLAVVNAAWTSGHNLVIDGYNTNDFFHLNFGWGGTNDGWYHLPSGMPYNLTVFEGIVVDIKPADISGIKDNSKSDAALSVFPNPAGEAVQIKFSSGNKEASHIRLFDSYGRLVMENMIPEASKSDIQANISLAGIRKGIYLLKISGSTETYSCKLIKL